MTEYTRRDWPKDKVLGAQINPIEIGWETDTFKIVLKDSPKTVGWQDFMNSYLVPSLVAWTLCVAGLFAGIPAVWLSTGACAVLWSLVYALEVAFRILPNPSADASEEQQRDALGGYTIDASPHETDEAVGDPDGA